MRKLKIEYINQKDLHINDDNVNVHSSKSIEKIAKSIKAFGFKNPIIIDKNNIAVCGSGRLEASRTLKIDEVPCIIADDLSEDELKAFAIADNRVADESFFDDDKLSVALQDLEDSNFDISGLGFDGSELDDILSDDEFEDGKDKDREVSTNEAGTVVIFGKFRQSLDRDEYLKIEDKYNNKYNFNEEKISKAILKAIKDAV